MRGKVLVMLTSALCFADLGLAQWTRVQTPEIRIPLATYAVAASGGTIMVGTYRGTIYRSTDGGSHWAKSDSGITNIYWTFNFFIEGDTIFAMGEPGIFRSTDMGTSWLLRNNGLPSLPSINVYSMVRSGNLLFAATDYGVYRSLDNGDNWFPSTGESSFWPVYSLAVSNGILYAGVEGTGVYISANNGNSWYAINPGLPIFPNGYFPRINALFVDGQDLYAGTDGLGIYRLSNHASMWLPETTGLKSRGNGYYYSTYSITKVGQYIFAGTQDDGIYRLSKIGGSWSQVNNGLPSNAYVTSIIEKGEGIIVAEHFSGVYYSTSVDSIVWIPQFADYPGKVDVGTVASSGNNLFLKASSEYYNGSISGVYHSSNVGISWYSDSVLTRAYIRKFRSYGDSVYAIGNGLFFSSNNGNKWSQIDSTLISLNTLLKSNDTLFAGWGYDYWQWGESGGVLLSADNGQSWSEIGKSDTAVSALAKIGNNLFEGGLHGVFRSTNTGMSWHAVNKGLPTDVAVYSLTTVGSELFACAGTSVYLSTNNGDDWVVAINGLPIDTSQYGSPVHLLVHENLLLAGTKNGVYISTNSGASWVPVNDSLKGDALLVYSLAVLGNDLIVAAPGGLWRRPLSEIVSAENDNEIVPQEFHLYQNYPNPFNPTASISFSLPKESYVSLLIYDILGREVSRLVQEVRQPGSYSVSWNAGEVSSGVYFYQLRAGEFVETKKMVLIR